MKKIAFFLIILAMLVFPAVALAAGEGQAAPGIDTSLKEYFAALGLGFLVPFVVEMAKKFGWVPDGSAGGVATICNAALYLIVVLLGAWGVDLEGDLAQSVISVLDSLSKLLLMVGTSFVSFNQLRGANVKGFRKRTRR